MAASTTPNRAAAPHVSRGSLGRRHASRTTAAIAVPAGGVLALSGVGVDWGEPGTALGLGAALAAGTLWGLYVVLGKRLSGRVNGLDGLAVGMAAGAVAVAPFVATTAGAALAGPGLFATVVGVALLSSVVPYALD